MAGEGSFFPQINIGNPFGPTPDRNRAFATEEQRKYARKMADELLKKNTPQIKHWTQGVAHLLDTLVGTQYQNVAGENQTRAELERGVNAPIGSFNPDGPPASPPPAPSSIPLTERAKLGALSPEKEEEAKKAAAAAAAERAPITPPEGINIGESPPGMSKLPPIDIAAPSKLGGPEAPPNLSKQKIGESRFSPVVNQAIENAANKHGVPINMLKAFATIESSGKPGASTGSYHGLFQLGRSEFARYGGSGNIFDPNLNADVAARKLKAESAEFKAKYGREPDAADLYMVHQQGVGGAHNHMMNPEKPAWENMWRTGEGQRKGPGWARLAIRGNIPVDAPERKIPLDQLTSKQFTDMWRRKVEKFGGVAPKPPALEMAPETTPGPEISRGVAELSGLSKLGGPMPQPEGSESPVQQAQAPGMPGAGPSQPQPWNPGSPPPGQSNPAPYAQPGISDYQLQGMIAAGMPIGEALKLARESREPKTFKPDDQFQVNPGKAPSPYGTSGASPHSQWMTAPNGQTLQPGQVGTQKVRGDEGQTVVTPYTPGTVANSGQGAPTAEQGNKDWPSKVGQVYKDLAHAGAAGTMHADRLKAEAAAHAAMGEEGKTAARRAQSMRALDAMNGSGVDIIHGNFAGKEVEARQALEAYLGIKDDKTPLAELRNKVITDIRSGADSFVKQYTTNSRHDELRSSDLAMNQTLKGFGMIQALKKAEDAQRLGFLNHMGVLDPDKLKDKTHTQLYQEYIEKNPIVIEPKPGMRIHAGKWKSKEEMESAVPAGDFFVASDGRVIKRR